MEPKKDADSSQVGHHPGEKKPNRDMQIVGLNVLAFVIYTIISFIIQDMVLGGIILCVHFLVCLSLAFMERKWAWLFSGLIILVIGFATCVGMGITR